MIPDWESQQNRDRATSGCNKKNLIRPILFLYYEESLVSSNLNSNLLRFHCAHPNLHTCSTIYLFRTDMVCILGWALWNRNSFEFKFDDTRLSSYYKNKIGPIRIFFVASWLCKVSALLTVSAKLESLVSSNLNSKLLWFHSVRPNLHLCLNLDTEGNKACKEAVTSSVHSFFFCGKKST